MEKILVNPNRCKGCGLCVDACPQNIIAIDHQHITPRGVYPIKITDHNSCTLCKSCITICPDCAILKGEHQHET